MRCSTEVDLDQTVSRAEYRRVFPGLQERVRALQYELLAAEIPTVVVFEGWDAAGKGTVIGRLTERLDPRAFRVHPGSPPSELEQRYHFLWRYQMRLPEDGHMAVFDHSWYGRVLVERVEKLARKREWKPAYDQINEFERWLADDGQVVVKFFLHISQKEQRRRLRAMEKDPAQRWKVEKEDWRRNRRYDRWMRGGGRHAGPHPHRGLPLDGGGGHRPALDAPRRLPARWSSAWRARWRGGSRRRAR